MDQGMDALAFAPDGLLTPDPLSLRPLSMPKATPSISLWTTTHHLTDRHRPSVVHSPQNQTAATHTTPPILSEIKRTTTHLSVLSLPHPSPSPLHLHPAHSQYRPVRPTPANRHRPPTTIYPSRGLGVWYRAICLATPHPHSKGKSRRPPPLTAIRHLHTAHRIQHRLRRLAIPRRCRPSRVRPKDLRVGI